MQYILSEEEYKNLNEKLDHHVIELEARLMKVCRMVANTVPVKDDDDDDIPFGDPEPWGCIQDVEYEHVCDECPVCDDCPYKYKEWSK